jgi:exosortase/archaeosortase
LQAAVQVATITAVVVERAELKLRRFLLLQQLITQSLSAAVVQQCLHLRAVMDLHQVLLVFLQLAAVVEQFLTMLTQVTRAVLAAVVQDSMVVLVDLTLAVKVKMVEQVEAAA